MADAAIFVGWNEAKTGREALAGELFGTAMAYYGSLVQKGTIESFEPVILSRHGGDLNGFILLRGDADKLHALVQTDEWLEMVNKAILCLGGFGVVPAYTGEGVQKVMQSWMKAIPK
jgi:hypothetical protein